MIFQFKLKLFKFIQKIFILFNFKLYYSKDHNLLKNIIIDDIEEEEIEEEYEGDCYFPPFKGTVCSSQSYPSLTFEVWKNIGR